MRDFYDMLKEEIEAYEGRHDDLIYLAPEFYLLMTNLLDDPRLPHRLRPAVACAVAYFILPADIIPEDLLGPYGYVDDIWLCAFVAHHVQDVCGDVPILRDNWQGEGEIGGLTSEILGKEEDLIGTERDRIIAYVGVDALL